MPRPAALAPKALEQNLQRRVDRTALPQKTGREMEVDVRSLGEVPCHLALVAGALKLFQPPHPDALGLLLAIDLDFRRRNAFDLFHTPTFERKRPADVPPRRDLKSEKGKGQPTERAIRRASSLEMSPSRRRVSSPRSQRSTLPTRRTVSSRNWPPSSRYPNTCGLPER
jgi:hypothetical protein